MDDNEIYRAIGSLESGQEDTQRRLLALEQKVDSLISLVAAAKGGWKTLLAVGAIAGSVGAAIVSFINMWRH